MSIRITEDDVVNYENSPDVNRKLFPNLNICGKEIDKLADEIDGKAPAVFSTASGSIASFTDGADDMPMKSCVVSIEPIQEGEGDPSPENVRPISGRTGLSVVRYGKNLLPNNAFTSTTKQGLTYTVNPDGTVSVSGTATANSYIYCEATFPESVIINGVPESNGVAVAGTSIQVYSTTPDVGGTITQNNTSMVIPANEPVLIRLRINTGVTVDNALFKPMARISTDTDYSFEPYKGSTYSVNWEIEVGTVYGGAVDVISGKLTVDRGYIASYNGETLPSTWISDRDVYAAGTSPTTGAQVVYKLAEPVEYQFTPHEVRTLLGVNNVWSDGGDVTVEYPTDTKTYIDAKVSPAHPVQVNGTSILNEQGVANVPWAGADNPGVVMVMGDYGVGYVSQGNKRLMLYGATDSEIRQSSNAYKTSTVAHQHQSAFYGLAKAAGDTTQSASDNPVGSYTEDAKTAIQIMLGISNIIGSVEGATASTTYSAGDLFLHSGALYEATVAIASGDAIVPGTNCEQTTIIDILKGA